MKTEEFKFENGLKLRVPLTENETSWFIAADICEILSISDTRQAVERLDEDEKRKEKIVGNGQARELWLVNEFGLYSLILASDKIEAKTFKRWVTHDVLPALRKTGKYTLDEANARESLIQEKIKEIESIEEKIKESKNHLSFLKENLGDIQIELKQILKADFRNLQLNLFTEQV